MAAAGLLTDDTISDDGKVHRFRVAGDKPKSTNGWYILYGDSLPAGSFGSWKTGLTETWCSKPDNTLTTAERDANRQRFEQLRQERESAQNKAWAAAARKAAGMWQRAASCQEHAYLSRKGVASFGLRVFQPNGGEPVLMVPLLDDKAQLQNIQFIQADGQKRFLSSGKKKGCYYMIGEPENILCIAEGYATASSIYMATGHACFVAFDRGNLEPVAKLVRKASHNARIVICSDNDQYTLGPIANPGMVAGIAAAQSIDGLVAYPVFDDLTDQPTDFNDLHQRRGTEAVKRAIEAALPPADVVIPLQYQQANLPDSGEQENKVSMLTNFQGESANPTAKSTTTANKPSNKDALARQAFHCNEQTGVWYYPPEKDGIEPAPIWLCDYLKVLGHTRNSGGKEWGYLVELQDKEQNRKRLKVTAAMLQDDASTEFRKLLASEGLNISTFRGARIKLAEYVQQPLSVFIRSVESTGWHGRCYVMPDRVIGNQDEALYYENEVAGTGTAKRKGSLEDWRKGVAGLCQGNSRLMFSVSVSFASILLHLVGAESGGFHFVGDSSQGKTTALRVAASTWGAPDHVRTWRHTSNALEAVAHEHNDGTLCLDEIAQVDAKEAGESAYMLANGSGKGRRNQRAASNQALLRWRLLFLSSGEVDLQTLMATVGKKAQAGQEVRLLHIAADAGRGMGLFENLNNAPDAEALSKSIQVACAESYGTPAPAFIERTIEHWDTISSRYQDYLKEFLYDNLSVDASGQAKRAASRFALVGFAGELASEWEITGWQSGQSIEAARMCFGAWLEHRGGEGNQEELTILRQVKQHFEAHGDARYTEWDRADDTHAPKTMNRMGFKKHDKAMDKTEYFVLTEAFRTEICKGLDYKTVEKVLIKHSWIQPGKKDGKDTATRSERVPIMGNTRVYRFTSTMWQADSLEIGQSEESESEATESN